MNAIPQSYPVLVEFAAGAKTPVLGGVLGELVHVGNSTVAESGTTQVRLAVAARDESTARQRASKFGQVLEVGKPSPLQHYANQKALPYRRSFIMSRFKRGRFNVQGGAGSHQAASAPTHPDQVSSPASGVGMSVGESVDALLGRKPTFSPQRVDEMRKFDTEFVLPREIRPGDRIAMPGFGVQEVAGVQIDGTTATFVLRGAKGERETVSQHTSNDVERVIGYTPEYAAAYGESCNKHRGKKKRKPAPKTEGRTTMPTKPALESTLAGYEEATRLYQQIASAPVEWLRSNRGRKIVMDGIDGVRLREGNVPADALESFYLDDRLPLTEPPLAAGTVNDTVAESGTMQWGFRYGYNFGQIGGKQGVDKIRDYLRKHAGREGVDFRIGSPNSNTIEVKISRGIHVGFEMAQFLGNVMGGTRLDNPNVAESLNENTVPPGLLKWVNDYKLARQYGNVSLAKQLKAGIDKEIKRLKLNPKAVYGEDPRPGQGTTVGIGEDGPGLYEVRATFPGERETNIAVGNILRFSEAVQDAKGIGPTEAAFTVNAVDASAAENHVRETLYRLNLKAGSVVKVAGSGVPLQLTQDARAETGTDPALLFDL